MRLIGWFIIDVLSKLLLILLSYELYLFITNLHVIIEGKLSRYLELIESNCFIYITIGESPRLPTPS